MSVKLDSITNTVLPSCNVGTMSSSDNSTYAASTAFVRNMISFLNVIVNNATSYTITAVKTFTSLYLTNGITSSVSIGPTTASQVNVLPATSTSASIQVFGIPQSLQPAISPNVFTIPIVTSSNTTCRIQCGIYLAPTATYSITFPQPFTVAPYVISNSTGSAPANRGVYNITTTGFQITSNVSQNLSWVAVGY